MRNFCLFAFLMCLGSFTGKLEAENAQFDPFIAQHLALDLDGKIVVPRHLKHVKLDIGLSYNAPIAGYWLDHEEDLVVFGFEPNPAAIEEIKRGGVKKRPYHGEPLDPRYIGTRFFLVPCALGLSTATTVPFYVTAADCGCSSLYEPKDFEVADIIEVPLFSLSDFFDRFPFDTHPVIDYIKIDAQGSDLNIVKSAGNYLSERVVYITLEPEDFEYRNTANSESAIEYYMNSIGFMRHRSSHTVDPTYINIRFLQYAKENNIQIYQY